jgi:hypothetical protein
MVFFNKAAADPDAHFPVNYPLPEGSGKLLLDDVRMTPSQLVLKLAWDSKRQASSNSLSKREKSPSGEIQQVISTPLATGNPWIEVVEWTRHCPSAGNSPGMKSWASSSKNH